MYRILEYNQQKDIQEEYDMPALSMFYGIIVRMQSEKGGKHNKPHIHAIYGGKRYVETNSGKGCTEG